MSLIDGESFTALTVNRKFVLVLSCPSLTVTVIVAVPFWLASGVTVTVQFEPDPPKTMLLVGTNAGSDEFLSRLRFTAAASPSSMVNEIAPVDVSSLIAWSAMLVIVGGVDRKSTRLNSSHVEIS